MVTAPSKFVRFLHFSTAAARDPAPNMGMSGSGPRPIFEVLFVIWPRQRILIHFTKCILITPLASLCLKTIIAARAGINLVLPCTYKKKQPL